MTIFVPFPFLLTGYPLTSDYVGSIRFPLTLTRSDCMCVSEYAATAMVCWKLAVCMLFIRLLNSERFGSLTRALQSSSRIK